MRIEKTNSNFSGKVEIVIILFTRILSMLAGIGTMSLLAWMLGPEGRGAFAVCLLFGMVMGVIFTVGVDRAAQFHVRVNAVDQARWFWGGVAILGIGIGLGALSGYFLIGSTYSFFKKAETSDFKLSLWIILFSNLGVYLQLQLEGLRRFKQLGLFIMVQTIGTLLGTFSLLHFFDLGVKGAILGQVIGFGLLACLIIWDLFANRMFQFEWPHKKQFQSLFSYGIKFYPARVGNLLAPQLGVFFLAILGGQEEIGLFAAASALATKVGIFSQTLETAVFPRVAQNPKGSFDLIDQSMRAAFFVTALPMAAVLVFSVPIVAVLLSPEFFPAIPLLWILTPGVIVKGGTLPLFAFFRAINLPGIISLSMLVEICISSLGFIVFYQSFGLVGGAWAITIGNFCSCLILFSSYVQYSNKSLKKILFPNSADIKLLRKYMFYVYQKLQIR